MASIISAISPNRLARSAGFGYLIIIVAGIFAEFIVRGSLKVTGDAAATFANIAGAQAFFRFSLLGDMVMIAADVFVAVALYLLLKAFNPAVALFAALMRLIQAAILGANLLNLAIVALLVGGAGTLAALDQSHVQALVTLYLNAHQYGYALGLVFFGLHCLALSYLLLKSRLVPRLLAMLIFIAGLGYLTDSLARYLLTDYAVLEAVLSAIVFIPAFVAELSLCLWLIIKGVRTIPGT